MKSYTLILEEDLQARLSFNKIKSIILENEIDKSRLSSKL